MARTGNVTDDERGPRGGPTLVDLSETFDAAVFHEFYDEVLARSIPAPELEPREVLEARLLGGEPVPTLVHVAVQADGRVAGGVVCEWYPGSNCLLAAYLAVRPSLRSRGIGSALMQQVLAGHRAGLRPLLVLGEVDDPRVAPAEAGDAMARLRFFGRLSARLVRLPYLQPEVRPGTGRVRMLLVALWADAAALVGDEAVRAEVVSGFLEEYFTRMEGPPPVDDRTYHALLAWTAGTEGIALLPLERFEELAGSWWDALR